MGTLSTCSSDGAGPGPCIRGRALGVASGAGPGRGRGGAELETLTDLPAREAREGGEKLLVPGARVKAAGTRTVTQQGSGLTFRARRTHPIRLAGSIPGSGEAGWRPEPEGCRMLSKHRAPGLCGCTAGQR